MITKDAFCEAFCDEIDVRPVPVGYAINTPFSYADGDHIGFYAVRTEGGYRLEDSGTLIPWLESTGVNLQTGPRAEQLQALLSEHNASFDEDSLEVHTETIGPEDIAVASVRFVSLLLRLQDLQLLRPEIVEKTFSEDVRNAINVRFGAWAEVSFDTHPIQGENDYTADIMIKPPEGDPLAVYLATRDSRVDEAVMAWMESQILKASSSFKVAVIYESDKLPPGISRRSYRRATNRVDGTIFFRGDESGAIAKIGRMIGAPTASDLATRH